MTSLSTCKHSGHLKLLKKADGSLAMEEGQLMVSELKVYALQT